MIILECILLGIITLYVLLYIIEKILNNTLKKEKVKTEKLIKIENALNIYKYIAIKEKDGKYAIFVFDDNTKIFNRQLTSYKNFNELF